MLSYFHGSGWRLEPFWKFEGLFFPSIFLGGHLSHQPLVITPGRALYRLKTPLYLSNSDLQDESRWQMGHPYEAGVSRCFPTSNSRVLQGYNLGYESKMWDGWKLKKPKHQRYRCCLMFNGFFSFHPSDIFQTKKTSACVRSTHTKGFLLASSMFYSQANG